MQQLPEPERPALDPAATGPAETGLPTPEPAEAVPDPSGQALAATPPEDPPAPRPSPTLASALFRRLSADPRIGGLEAPPAMVEHYGRLAQANWERAPDLAVALDAAYTQLRKRWAPSLLGDTPGLALDPPEHVYGAAGLSTDANAAWIGRQRDELAAAEGYTGPFEGLRCSPAPGQHAPDGRPLYTIEAPDETGGHAPLPGRDGAPLLWRPSLRDAIQGGEGSDTLAGGLVEDLLGYAHREFDRLTDTFGHRANAGPLNPRAPAVPPPPPEPNANLGVLSAVYESSGRGPGLISHGKGDHGGKSYGVYQFASAKRKPQAFLANEGKPWEPLFKGLPVGSARFDAVWRQVAKQDPEGFRRAQHAFIERTYYQNQLDMIRARTGIDLSGRSFALRNALWSTTVQHGEDTELFLDVVKALGARAANPESDADIIRAVYAERGRKDAKGVVVHFRSSSPAWQSGVVARFAKEERDALALLQREKGAAGANTPNPAP